MLPISRCTHCQWLLAHAVLKGANRKHKRPRLINTRFSETHEVLLVVGCSCSCTCRSHPQQSSPVGRARCCRGAPHSWGSPVGMLMMVLLLLQKMKFRLSTAAACEVCQHACSCWGGCLGAAEAATAGQQAMPSWRHGAGDRYG